MGGWGGFNLSKLPDVGTAAPPFYHSIFPMRQSSVQGLCELVFIGDT